MIALLEDNREAIAELCGQFGVRRLSVFGSAAKGTFDLATSDVDFLVDLGNYEDRVAKRFMGFVAALEDLMGRRIDIVTEKAVSDPDFRRELDATAEVIYGAETRQTAA